MSAVQDLDWKLLHFLNHLGQDELVREAVIRALATGIPYVLLGIVVALALSRRGRLWLLTQAGTCALAAVLVAKLLNQLLPRERPFVQDPVFVRHVELVVRPDSFPSVHAVFVFALATAVLLSPYRRWGWLMVALSALVLAARVAAGVHFPSDVLGGAAIGVAVSAAVTYALRRRRSSRPAGASPQAGEAAP